MLERRTQDETQKVEMVKPVGKLTKLRTFGLVALIILAIAIIFFNLNNHFKWVEILAFTTINGVNYVF